MFPTYICQLSPPSNMQEALQHAGRTSHCQHHDNPGISDNVNRFKLDASTGESPIILPKGKSVGDCSLEPPGSPASRCACARVWMPSSYRVPRPSVPSGRRRSSHGKPFALPLRPVDMDGPRGSVRFEKTPPSPQSLPQELLLPRDSAQGPTLTPTHRGSFSTKKIGRAPPSLDPSPHPRFPTGKRRGSVCPHVAPSFDSELSEFKNIPSSLPVPQAQHMFNSQRSVRGKEEVRNCD